ncbi:methyltransferase-like protein 7A [Ixodes scapularis]|uniref:methyltransferase-like protein 7A n=1 Tax=Ixodes scapularis TaxID=6945 RepID=UPI001C387D31|nr:methyltransferase-like protein 7A [Ixodes scapularis]
MDRLVNLSAYCFLYGFLTFGLLFLVPLKLSRKFRQACAHLVFPALLHLSRDQLDGIRRRVVSQLNDLQSHDDDLKEEGAIRVLEIGTGYGANFEHITRKVRYTNVEPSREFDEDFLSNLGKNPKVKLERWIRGWAEDMPDVPDNSVDVVLVTYLLCTVTDVQRTLAECKRVLVKGGRLVFLEHVAHPEASWGFILQRLLDPLWSVVFGGCYLTRRTGDVLAKAGFAQLELAHEFLPVPAVLSPHVYGFASIGPSPGPFAEDC